MGLVAKNKKEDNVLTKGSDIVAILDADWCTFSCASVGDEQYIEVLHVKSGKKMEFKNKTAFKGVGKKIGGWLGDINAEREEDGKTPFTLDMFEITPKNRRKVEYKSEKDKEGNTILDKKGDPILKAISPEQSKINIFHSAKSVINTALKSVGAGSYEAYIGKSGRMREEISTLMKYKGNRENTLTPLLMSEVVDYVTDAFDATLVENIEADDAVVMRAYGDPNAVIVGEDKDYYGQPVKFFNVNRPDEGIIDGDCFGELRVEEKIRVNKKTGKETKDRSVKGYGRLFLYWQILNGDSTDNYKANCFSNTKFGGISAYEALADCKDDKEALEKVIEVFKMLYPEPKIVTGWRGNEFLIDWLYVAREQFMMAAMLRFEGDRRTLDTEFAKHGVRYEY